jgi:hypothetical protein
MQRVLMGLSGATLCVAAALWLITSATSAQSDAGGGDIAAAASAFGDGQKAQLRGEYARAAELFELADELAPTPEALRSAIRNHVAAGQLARAATQALRAKARYADARTQVVADRALLRLAPKLARLSIVCDAPCALLIDREALTLGLVPAADVFVLPGTHSIEARFATERSDVRELVVKAGEHLELMLREPPRVDEPEASVQHLEVQPPRAPLQPSPRNRLVRSHAP